jgi:ribokinase
VTRGAEGALWTDGSAVVRAPAEPAAVVDTTGAGDAFCGVLAARMATGSSLDDAIVAANAAGALAVGAAGAREGMPMHEALEAFLGQV